MSVVDRQECGFQNPESANYCSRCGASSRGEQAVETTKTFYRRGRRHRAR